MNEHWWLESARKWSDQVHEAILKRDLAIRSLREAGWTLREIAAEVGLSPEGVNKILKREQAR